MPFATRPVRPLHITMNVKYMGTTGQGRAAHSEENYRPRERTLTSIAHNVYKWRHRSFRRLVRPSCYSKQLIDHQGHVRNKRMQQQAWRYIYFSRKHLLKEKYCKCSYHCKRETRKITSVRTHVVTRFVCRKFNGLRFICHWRRQIQVISRHRK